MSIGRTFIRCINLHDDISLNIHQLELGDVGGSVWDAALVLIKFFETDTFYVDGKHIFDGANIVELGAGTGAVGLAAAAHGAITTLTDLNELLPLLRYNVEENKKVLKGAVHILNLKWGEETNWLKKPSFILVADCLYYDQSVHPLLKTLNELCDANTTVFFSFENRSDQGKDELQISFFKHLSITFHIEHIPLDQLHPEMCSEDIHVFRFRKKI